MITLKSTKKTLVDASTGREDYIYLNINRVTYTNSYKVRANYSFIDVDGNTKHHPEFRTEMSKEQVVAIESSMGGLVGENFNEKFDDLIVKSAIYSLTLDPRFGLTANDWEVYVEPVEEVVEVVEEI